MTTTGTDALSPAKRRWLITRSLLRAVAGSVGLVALYYLAPFDPLTRLPIGVTLGAALLVLLAVSVWQVRAILRARYPGIRAVGALAITAPVFLLLFAAAYYLTAQSDASSFNVDELTRTDTLYFTITVFSTVGFGDIAPVSQTARSLVSLQMILDLLILGLGIRLFADAVRLARRQTAGTASTLPPDSELLRPDSD